METKDKVLMAEEQMRRQSAETLLSPSLSSLSLVCLILMGMLSSKNDVVVSKRVVMVMLAYLGSGSINEQVASPHCHSMTAGVDLSMFILGMSIRTQKGRGSVRQTLDLPAHSKTIQRETDQREPASSTGDPLISRA
jgi:hypothetical protein